jgi:TP901 family phage tail tape measure protein
MAGTSLTSSIDIKLIDDVSKPARTVEQALKDAERAAKAAAKGMAETKASDRFVKSLAQLKLSAKDIETVAAAWKDFAKAEGLADDASKWTKQQIADVREWERAQLAALREVKREQEAFYRETTAAARAAQAAAPAGMISGMSAFGSANLESIRQREELAAAARRVTTGMSTAGALAMQQAVAAAAAEAHAKAARPATEMMRRMSQNEMANERLKGGMSGAGKAAAGVEIGAAEVAAAGGALGGIGLGHVAVGYISIKEVEEIVRKSREADATLRYQVAMADLTSDEMASRAAQAYRLGPETGLKPTDIMKAQQTLAGRGVKKQFVEPFVEELGNYSRAMNSSIEDSARTLETIIFSTNQHIENAAEAQTTMRRQIDIAVKAAKLGGLEDRDIQEAAKFGAGASHAAGFKNETFWGITAALSRAGYHGAEAGVAARAIASKLVSPSNKGFDALAAMGVNYNDFTTMPAGARAGTLDSMMKRRFGKSLSSRQVESVDRILADENLTSDYDKLIPALSNVMVQSFQHNGKGKVGAQDAQKVAKLVRDFAKMMTESVNVEGLLQAILETHPHLQQLNALFTAEHGAKVGALAENLERFKEIVTGINSVHESFAREIGDKRMEGLAGSLNKLEAAVEALELRIGAANAAWIKFTADVLAGAARKAAQLPDEAIAPGGWWKILDLFRRMVVDQGRELAGDGNTVKPLTGFALDKNVSPILQPRRDGGAKIDPAIVEFERARDGADFGLRKGRTHFGPPTRDQLRDELLLTIPAPSKSAAPLPSGAAPAPASKDGVKPEDQKKETTNFWDYFWKKAYETFGVSGAHAATLPDSLRFRPGYGRNALLRHAHIGVGGFSVEAIRRADAEHPRPPKFTGKQLASLVETVPGITSPVSPSDIPGFGGSRSWRNNNPGNLRHGEFAAAHGATGKDEKGFAVFPDAETGRAAQRSLLFDSPQYAGLSIREAIGKYAPAAENDTGAYVRRVTTGLGVGPEARLADLAPEQREHMLDIMREHEGWRPAYRARAASDAPAPAGTQPVQEGTTTIVTKGGRKLTVDARYAANFRGFLNDYEAAGGVVGPNSGGLGVRPGNASYHPIGRAIDVNQIGRNIRAGGVTLPVEVENRLAAKWGLRSGANFRSPDAGHFEVNDALAAHEALKANGVIAKDAPAPAPPPLDQRSLTHFLFGDPKAAREALGKVHTSAQMMQEVMTPPASLSIRGGDGGGEIDGALGETRGAQGAWGSPIKARADISEIHAMNDALRESIRLRERLHEVGGSGASSAGRSAQSGRVSMQSFDQIRRGGYSTGGGQGDW